MPLATVIPFEFYHDVCYEKTRMMWVKVNMFRHFDDRPQMWGIYGLAKTYPNKYPD